MRRTTLILWVVLLICAGLLLVLRVQKTGELSLIVRTNDAIDVPAVKAPAGVIRSSSRQAPDSVGLPAIREDSGRKTSPDEKKIDLPKQSGRDVVPNEFVFNFRNEADWNSFIAAAKAHGLEIKDAMRFGFSVRVLAKRLEDLFKAIDESAAPDKIAVNYYVRSPEIPKKEPMKPQGEYLPFGSQSLKWLGISGDNSAWGKGVIVAVLDNGITSSPMLREERIARVDLVKEKLGDAIVSGHANAVASIIAGSNEKAMGVAPESTLLSIKVLNNEGSGDAFTLAKGIIEAVDRGAGVINMCLGTSGDSYILKSAVDYALSKGVVLVSAAGNDGIDEVSYPARYEGVVATSGVDAEGKHLYFANYGKEVSISAPGIGVMTAWTGSELVGFSGTSAAVPFVSGAIAYLLSANPGMTADEAVSTLVKYADDAGAPGKDDIYGNGILNMRRVVERNQKGIYDVAIGDIYLPPYSNTDNQIKIIVSAQNRGTETAASVEVKADMDGAALTKIFNNVAVGQTVSMEIPVNIAEAKKISGIGLTYEVKLGGATDLNPKNNQRQAVVFVNSPRK